MLPARHVTPLSAAVHRCTVASAVLVHGGEGRGAGSGQAGPGAKVDLRPGSSGQGRAGQGRVGYNRVGQGRAGQGACAWPGQRGPCLR